METVKRLKSTLVAVCLTITSFPAVMLGTAAAEQSLMITEVCTQNKASHLDSYGSASDWIELYNGSDSLIALNGWTLADSGTSWTFPAGASIGAGEYLIVFASKAASTGTEYHTGFGLSKNGDSLTLCDSSGKTVQTLTIPALAEDRTYGLLPGSDEWSEMAPTPGAINVFSVAAPQFSLPSGFYDSADTPLLSLNASSDIYYTTDGSDPTMSASAVLYDGTLTLHDRSEDENIWNNYEYEDSSPYSIIIKTKYEAPDYPVEKANVIRAAAKDGDVWSEIITNTYFVMDSERLAYYREIPVVSLVTDGENLFNKDTGIYVVGQQFIDWKNSSSYDPDKSEWDTNNAANFFSKGRSWEREATMSLFQNGEMTLSQDMGIRIKGASTRNAAMKSFNVYARSEYGDSKLNFNLISDNKAVDDGKQIKKYDSFSLRAVSWINRWRDQIVQTPLKDIDNMATIDRDKAVVFLNGEYWGLYEIQEKISDFYIQSNYGIAKEDVAMIKDNALEEGTADDLKAYNDLINFIRDNDMSDAANYKAVTQQLDVDSMIEHFAVCLYTGMWDWPNHNYIVWRSNGAEIEGNPYSDGKWRFGTYDFEFTCGLDYSGAVSSYSYNMFSKLGNSSTYTAAAFIRLLDNPAFKDKFASRFCDYANVVYAPDKMAAQITGLTDTYFEYFTDSELRWNSAAKPTASVRDDEKAYLRTMFDEITQFFQKRPDYAITQMMSYCGLNKELYSVTLNTSGSGSILVNGIPAGELSDGLVCKYPAGTAITVSAAPENGESFIGWSGRFGSKETEVTFTVESDMELTANFGAYVPTGDVNADGRFSIADVVLMQKWLLGVPEAELADWQAGDLCKDNSIDAFDLVMMRGQLINTAAAVELITDQNRWSKGDLGVNFDMKTNAADDVTLITSDTAPKIWQIQAYYSGLSLKAGKTYQIQFTLSTDADSLPCSIGVQGTTDKFNTYEHMIYTSSITPQTHTFTFTMPEDCTNISLIICTGLRSGTYHFEDISLSNLNG
ncbi:MAG: CotH kinase family protein [Ruminococcus sp.]|nr:CotH kinase family protein [Ruminococcus sp.]